MINKLKEIEEENRIIYRNIAGKLQIVKENISRAQAAKICMKHNLEHKEYNKNIWLQTDYMFSEPMSEKKRC